MKIHSLSAFKDPAKGKAFLDGWNERVIRHSHLSIKGMTVESLLGQTQVWVVGKPSAATPIVVFPGFRTCALFWVLDGMIGPLAQDRQVFLIDTNGQPSHSVGNTPEIHKSGYGKWAADVIRKLGLEKPVVLGASFGGQVIMKLAAEAPGLIREGFLMNPGGLASFSLAPSNLYHNLLPIISPKPANVRKFLERSVLHSPTHQISPEAMSLLVEFEVFVLKNWRDRAQKPYAMKDAELQAANAKLHLLLGDQDPLFPHQKSMARAKLLPKLDHVHVLPGVAHGIELSHSAMEIVAEILGIGG